MANENHFAGIDEKYSNEYYGLNEEIMRVVSTSSKVTGLNAKTIALLTVVSTLEILNNVLSEGRALHMTSILYATSGRMSIPQIANCAIDTASGTILELLTEAE